jgi:hypothetical protein
MRQQPGKDWHFGSAQLALGLALLSGACTGEILSPGAGQAGAPGTCLGGVCGAQAGTGTGGGPGVQPATAVPGEVPMRRLNNAEYAYTLRDLFGSTSPAVTFPEEGRSEGYDTSSTALAVSKLHIEAYLDAGSAVVSELFEADPAGVRAGFCSYQAADAAANLTCAQQIVSGFAARAFRRVHSAWPDAQAETDYLALLEPTGPLAALSLELRLRTALEAVLVSPRFIYRVELTGADGKLDTPSLASRLSYFLWSSAPDAELSTSDLQQDAALESQVARLQQGERFERFLQRFPRLWLELEKLDEAERDLDVYPDFSPQLLAAMAQETGQFFASYWRSPSGTVGDFLLAPSPTPSGVLSGLYGSSPRLGLLTQAAIMTVTGAVRRTSPVRRGKWVLERLLCAPPPPPPDGLIAELTAELEADDSLTERERLARHRVNPTCAACHTLMDPIGLGFENYDSIGAYRTTERSGKPIDPSGQLPDGAPFAGPVELVGLLAQDQRVQGCVVRQLLTYGTGRGYDGNDDALVELVRTSAGGPVATFRSVLNSVVQSDAFRRRN